MTNESLKDRIKKAKSDVEVSELLKEGKTYIFASKKTKNSWSHAGRRILAGLKGQTYVQPKQEETEFVDVPKDKKKKKKKTV